jgi:hypothetical protein
VHSVERFGWYTEQTTDENGKRIDSLMELYKHIESIGILEVSVNRRRSTVAIVIVNSLVCYSDRAGGKATFYFPIYIIIDSEKD